HSATWEIYAADLKKLLTGSPLSGNPNDWSREVGDPRYILDLLGRVVTVSPGDDANRRLHASPDHPRKPD
ncbi:MAG: hypothetical protein ACRCYU_12920, partial [Nocardioides sp.]